MKVCRVDGCDRPVSSRGWCDRHYRRVLHHGDVDAGRIDRSRDDRRARLARGLAELDDPIRLAYRYLNHHDLAGGRDETDLVDVAVDAIIDAAIAWEPDAGRSMLSWAWLYMDRNVRRELGRCVARRRQLGETACISGDDHRFRYDPGHDPYRRVETRVDLQRWADLAELTPLMRWLVEYAALHSGRSCGTRRGSRARRVP